MPQLVQITTNYTRQGAIRSQEAHVAKTFGTLESAMAEFNGRGRGRTRFIGRDNSIRFELRDDNGQRLSMEDIYRLTVGEALFAQQLADPSFAINLDTWLANYVVTQDLAGSIDAAQQPRNIPCVEGLSF